MKKSENISTVQIILLVVGSLLVFLPIAWDILASTFTLLADVTLEDIVTRSGMFAVGVLILAGVGLVEIVKDFRDKPKSNYIK